jgi:hypothetical protein
LPKQFLIEGGLVLFCIFCKEEEETVLWNPEQGVTIRIEQKSACLSRKGKESKHQRKCFLAEWGGSRL